MAQQEEESRQLMIQYNSVLHSSSFENDERIESLTETISSLQKQLQELQKKANQLPLVEEELRTLLHQVNSLEKQNDDLMNTNLKLNLSMKEQKSWKEQYDDLFNRYQKLVEDQSRASELSEASNSEKFNELHQRLKDQREIMQSLREEKEEIENLLRQQIISQQQEIVRFILHFVYFLLSPKNNISGIFEVEIQLSSGSK